jgi:hypothetical protein
MVMCMPLPLAPLPLLLLLLPWVFGICSHRTALHSTSKAAIAPAD